jgi:hypothetical protein
MTLAPEHVTELRRAKRLLETPSLAARITDAIGAPIEKGFKMLPEKWAGTIDSAVRTSLEKALEVAIASLHLRRKKGSRDRFHRLAVMATGAGGGAFGLAGLVIELPVSTTFMLRSIAEIARREGEDLRFFEARLACMEVFALGGRSRSDDAVETGYFAIRSALAKSVSEAARYFGQKGVATRSAPALVRFISNISSRFGVVVSEKAAAMAIPAIGAAGGALVNSFFMRHFQDMAQGHFVVRRLERIYGAEIIRAEYEAIEM